MRRLLQNLSLLAALGLTACATNLEKTYEGPVARVADSADKTRDAGTFVPGKANMFYLQEIDGEQVRRTNFSATANRYSGADRSHFWKIVVCRRSGEFPTGAGRPLRSSGQVGGQWLIHMDRDRRRTGGDTKGLWAGTVA